MQQAAVEVLEWPLFFGGTTRLLSGLHGELDLFVLDAPHLFARPGNPYLSSEGVDWPDNGLRFGALARMADSIGLGIVPSFVPDIVHAHDWQAGLTPAYLNYSGRRRPRTVMTVHNLAYQGRYTHSLPPRLFNLLWNRRGSVLPLRSGAVYKSATVVAVHQMATKTKGQYQLSH
jgi:starch synthase